MKISLRTQYLLFIAVIHLALVYLIFKWLQENKLLFIVSEVFVLASLFMAFHIYRQFRQPSQFIASGIEAIKDQDFTIKFVLTGNREVDELIAVYNLMIDHLREERTRQREQQFFLEKLIEAAPIAILIFDFDGRVATLNAKAGELLRQKPHDFIGKTLDEINHPLLTQLADLQDGETRSIKTNGAETYRAQQSHFMDRGFRRAFLMLEELTSEILDTEKKAYGKVIRMMAHEVNNSIGAVNSILEVTQSVLNQPEHHDLSHALRVASERNDRLNRFMRRFADVVRLPLPQKQVAELTEVIGNVTQLMRPLAEARGVKLFESFGDASIPKAVDVGQFEQVLVNIFKNAIEVCTAGQEVHIIAATQRLVVRDNGTPISVADESNLFNPFFSTKPDGQGIGLTLSREILLNHGFLFSLKTNADGWTEFVISL